MAPRLRLLCLHGFRQNASSFRGRLAAFTKQLSSVAELIFADAPHVIPPLSQTTTPTDNATESVTSSQHSRRAWLIAHGPPMLDETQYLTQQFGWEQSLPVLQSIIREQGPFDGVLGFSQGAAVTSVLCALQQLQPEAFPSRFRFAVMFSGFCSPAEEHQRLYEQCRGIDIPSLHVFGATDRQISVSQQLADVFADTGGRKVVVWHQLGHVVPSSAEFIAQYEAFLAQFIEH
eukprot:TRINITY_DN14313_c0_g1_i1.p1 TRINITY_DN14313_c0_g1~~TRINITY_DN14313_c0_g1_i1.p1  ORF type:complete len:244 (-),score=23.35 TRINITY_DN14313_c0_g1_i1:128-823(-)